MNSISHYLVSHSSAKAQPMKFLFLIFTKVLLLASMLGLSASPTNVLLICIDDLRPELGCYGQKAISTPNIDRLADEGTLFERAYVQQAWCSPSRTSMLTGLRPDSTRVYDLTTHFRDQVPDAITLPQYFKQQGYFAASFGKVFHSGMDDEQSWSTKAWKPPVEDPIKAYLLPENLALTEQPRPGYAAPTESADVDDNAYPDGQVAQAAIKQLEALGEKPFFLAVGFYKPHLPFTAPEKYWAKYDRNALPMPEITTPPENAPPWAYRLYSEHLNYKGVPQIPMGEPLPDQWTRQLIHGYYAAVSYVDAQVGRLLTALDDLGLADNTMVVLWGDHGWKLGDYALWSKHTNYEVDTRVPLVIRLPGATGGKRISAIVECLDLYPTLVELAKLSQPMAVDGKTFAGLLKGGTNSHQGFAISQFIRNPGRGHTNYEQSTVIGDAIRTDQYRFVRWREKKSPYTTVALELYDHSKDPKETINVANQPEYSDTVEALTEKLNGIVEFEAFQDGVVPEAISKRG